MALTTTFDLLDLHSKPASYKFNDEEIEFIKKHEKKNQYIVKYALYNKKSKNNRYIAFIIDSHRAATRKSGVENYWNVIATRNLSNDEYLEIIQNFGTNIRRFKVYYYKNIEGLIEDDSQYDVSTPKSFVDVCIEKGYSLKSSKKPIQLKFNL